jgi:hypothetical protein
MGESLAKKAAHVLFLVLVIDSAAVFDYEDDEEDENDWQPRLFEQP